MADSRQLQEWRKYREQSRQALRAGAILGALVTGGLGIAFLFGARWPLWVVLLILAAGWFQFLGDWFNLRHLDRQIAASEREEGSPEA